MEQNNIKIYHIKNRDLVYQLYGRLHTGELEVIVSAKELKINHVIIDDRSARIMTNSMCLKTLGIMGILLIAKEREYILEIKKEIDSLIKSGYRISLNLYQEILKKLENLIVKIYYNFTINRIISVKTAWYRIRNDEV